MAVSIYKVDFIKKLLILLHLLLDAVVQLFFRIRSYMYTCVYVCKKKEQRAR